MGNEDMDVTASSHGLSPIASRCREGRQWGPFGMGQWKGHPNVYCRICGWPVYSMWIDSVPPPGDCPEGKSSARSCGEVVERLMMNAWTRAATGKPEPHESMEMLRKVTGLSWAEIEAMSDARHRGSHTIAQLKELNQPRVLSASEAPTIAESGDNKRG